MERLDIICVGTLKEKYLKDLCAEYQKRLTRFCKVNITELSEFKLRENPVEADIHRALEAEGRAMMSACDAGSFKIALCIEGEQYSSEKFSKLLDRAFLERGRVTLIIGSSHGISEDVKKQCDLRLSMSKMTFPHQLARGMLLEQVYRAYMIRTDRAYHK